MSANYPINYLVSLILVFSGTQAFSQNPEFPWPEGKKMAISLSFDDARQSNTEFGIPLLNEYGVKATFFVLPSNVKFDLNGWKSASAAGHEIANHSMIHPCSGNFAWSRNKALENYTLDRMRNELQEANEEIEKIFGVQPKVYAYPCGLNSVGQGTYTESFVPLISEMFLAGRGWLGENPNDPFYVDMAQLTGMKTDNTDFEEILPIIEAAASNGQWLVLAGHETNDSGIQTTYLSMLRALLEYASDSANGIWIAPIGTVGEYVKEKRESMAGRLNIPQIVRVSKDGNLKLTAEKGMGIGPDIKYMPDWNAFGWFTAKDRVEWDVVLHKADRYEVWMEWSVSDEESGKEFVLEAGENKIKGKVGKSGSWETFKKVSLGQIKLEEGYNKIVFKPSDEFKGEALLDLRELILIPKSGTDTGRK